MTLHYYQNHAQDLLRWHCKCQYDPAYCDGFHLTSGSWCPSSGCRLCAVQARCKKAFHEMGYQVDAFDASSAMVELYGARQHRATRAADELFRDRR